MPIGPLGVAAVSSGIDLVGGLVGGMFGQNQARKAWKEQADYNSPARQMERLKQAGLNPNLVYGNGSATNTMSQSYDTIKPNTGNVGSQGLSNYIALKNQKMQNDLIQKQQEFITAQIADKMSSIKYRDQFQSMKLSADTDYTNLVAKEKKLMLDFLPKNLSLDQLQKQKDLEKTGLEVNQLSTMLKYYPQQLQNDILYTRAKIRNMNVNTQKQQIEKMMLNLAKKYRENGVEVNDNILLRQFNDVIQWGKQSWKDLFKGWKW